MLAPNSVIPEGTEGEEWSYLPNLTAGQGVTWTLSPNAPAWANVDSGTGEVHGTPSLGDQAPFHLIATNSNGTTSQTIAFTVYDKLTSIVAALSSYTGASVTHALQAQGGKGPYSWSWVTPEADRPNLTPDNALSVLTGTATNGTWNDLELLVEDAGGRESISIFDMIVQAVSANWLVFGDARFSGLNDAELSPGIEDLDRFDKIYAGVGNACGIDGGSVYCWGSTTTVAIGERQGTGPLYKIPTVTDAVKVSIGQDYACAISSGGAIWCWGDNNRYQTGDSVKSGARPPYRIHASGVTDVYASYGRTCIIYSSDGSNYVYCWGSGGAFEADNRTQRYMGIANAVSLQGAENATCALMSNKRVRCWGYPYVNGTAAATTGETTVLLPMTDIASLHGGGGNTVYAITETGGEVYSWGAASGSGASHGDVSGNKLPGKVPLLQGSYSIHNGPLNSCAVFIGGFVRCWGNMDGSSKPPGMASGMVALPTDVEGLTGIEEMSFRGTAYLRH